MSQDMERAVMTAPYDVAMADELSRMQFWSRAQLIYKELEQARAALASQQAVKGEPARPDILERLSYHTLERDDLTLDECLAYLAKGWAKVHGRTERQMVMQILALLAGQSASPPSRDPLTDEQIAELYVEWSVRDGSTFADLIRAVEAHHGIHSREGGSK